jgi:type IV pilus assembly protein PilA
MQRRDSLNGFTLIELMIVVAIIAILAAIAIPAYQNYLVRTQVSEGMVLADGAKTGIWDFFAQNGRPPTGGNGSVGLAQPASISGNYVSSVTVTTNGQIQVAYGTAQANTAIASDFLVLSPAFSNGSVTWNCTTYTTIPSAYLPSSCRN